MSEEQKEQCEQKEEAAATAPVAAPTAPPVKKNPVEDTLKAAFGDSLQTGYNRQGELELRVERGRLKELCRALLNGSPRYDYLRNLTAVDWKDRMEMVCHVCATESMETVVVKCDVARETPAVDTVTDVWPGANWLEREVYDLFGISIAGHPDLRRIMLPEEWEGHPLRKDYVMPEEQTSGSKLQTTGKDEKMEK